MQKSCQQNRFRNLENSEKEILRKNKRLNVVNNSQVIAIAPI